MEAAAVYAFFAERYHWTKQQVDEQPLWYIQRLRDIAAISDEVRAEKAKTK